MCSTKGYSQKPELLCVLDKVSTVQVFFPLAPGIETIYEPAMEEVEEALENARKNMEHMHADISDAAHRVEKRVEDWARGGDDHDANKKP